MIKNISSLISFESKSNRFMEVLWPMAQPQIKQRHGKYLSNVMRSFEKLNYSFRWGWLRMALEIKSSIHQNLFRVRGGTYIISTYWSNQAKSCSDVAGWLVRPSSLRDQLYLIFRLIVPLPHRPKLSSIQPQLSCPPLTELTGYTDSSNAIFLWAHSVLLPLHDGVQEFVLFPEGWGGCGVLCYLGGGEVGKDRRW